eukprot:scaffold246_cov181-Ochromonas_danica.AAC.3
MGCAIHFQQRAVVEVCVRGFSAAVEQSAESAGEDDGEEGIDFSCKKIFYVLRYINATINVLDYHSFFFFIMSYQCLQQSTSSSSYCSLGPQKCFNAFCHSNRQSSPSSLTQQTTIRYKT